jgi:hypothetical protein
VVIPAMCFPCENRFVPRIPFPVEVISVLIEWTVIITVAILPIVLDVDALRRLTRSPTADSRASWGHRAAYVGTASNIFVYGLPITLLIHNIIVNSPWDSGPIYDAMTALFVLSMVLAIVGPKHVRAQLIIGVLLPFFFWLALPRGIL